MDPLSELASGVLALVAPPLDRLHWVPPLEESLGGAVSADEDEVGFMAMRLLGVGNGTAGAVEDGLPEDPTLKRGSLAQLQPQKISGSGV